MMRKVDFYTVSIENAIGEVILSKASMLLVVIFNQNSSFRFQENDFVNISKCTKQIENLNQSSLCWLESIRVDHLGFLCSWKKITSTKQKRLRKMSPAVSRIPLEY